MYQLYVKQIEMKFLISQSKAKKFFYHRIFSSLTVC